MEKNLTTGSVMKNIIFFSLPFLLSYFLQTLYGLADLYIVGLFGSDAEVTASVTAVSNGSQIMHMLTVMIVGLAMGGTVLIGKAVGGNDKNLKNLAIGNTVTLFSIIAVIATTGLLFCVDLIIKIMSVPEEAAPGTIGYLLICFAGIPFIIAYNIISSIFRGMGDSKSPMYFIAVACFVNIGLDFLFIGALGMGPAGAALGTTLAQTVSVIVALIAIIKKKMISGLNRRHFKLNKTISSDIIKVGLPISLQDGFIQISFLLISIFANNRGLADAAAVGVVEKLIGILFLVPSTLLSSVSALCAQNVGAGRHDRASKTMWYAIGISTAFGIFFFVLFQFIAEWSVGLFDSTEEVMRLGGTYMRSYVIDCIFAGIHFIFSGYFCAYSKSGISFLHNLISILLARIPIAYYASIHYPDTLFPMGMAAPIGSLISIGICVVAYILLKRKQT